MTFQLGQILDKGFHRATLSLVILQYPLRHQGPEMKFISIEMLVKIDFGQMTYSFFLFNLLRNCCK